MRTYDELCQLHTLEERFDYLVLHGEIGQETFGYDRWFNQSFYKSREWRQTRSFVITRDNGNDMALDGHPISGRPYIHHMNPIMIDDVVLESDNLINPDFLICVSHRTHNAIHYGDRSLLPRTPVSRAPGDTSLW
jgi:hypothetical protein